MVEKLKGVIFDGRWEFTHKEDTCYVLKNIYNGETVKLSRKQMLKVMNGEDTISHIQTRRIGTNGNRLNKQTPYWWQNGINKSYSKQIKKAKEQLE